MKILGTGLSGLVGSRVVELLSGFAEFENLSLETGVDITDANVFTRYINASDAAWVFHFAAVTDVDAAERERGKGKDSLSWRVNVEATRTACDACHATGKRLLYISTDYVFAGDRDAYIESDRPNPAGWYGTTKYEGERLVAALGDAGLIVRIANPYRSPWQGKPDFVAKIRDRLKKHLPVSAPGDQVFVPTYIDDIAGALRVLVRKNASGIFHAVGSGGITPLEAARAICRLEGVPESAVSETTFAEYYRGRAPRPLHAYLKNDRITESGMRMKTFAEGLHAAYETGGTV